MNTDGTTVNRGEIVSIHVRRALLTTMEHAMAYMIIMLSVT